ncbi:hypothetical protein DERF_003721 [Dermatophagoides farinae]|uniref:Uncharacterized protein n=1 Tax=Dermatophagoides farinae TaxID=6954 RepID=A0A922IHB8_DERFA|nr:hypothetical protein DERF_003721 [Dermatophagoides farinae]
METKTEVSSLIGRYLLLKIGATTTKLLFLAKQQQQQQEKKSKNFDDISAKNNTITNNFIITNSQIYRKSFESSALHKSLEKHSVSQSVKSSSSVNYNWAFAVVSVGFVD